MRVREWSDGVKRRLGWGNGGVPKIKKGEKRGF